MKKRLKILIICLSSVLIVAFIVLVIVNYFVLPPKVTANAQKFKYNQNNILKLKSITVDGDKVIYEFSSLNKYFNKNYASKNKSNKSYLELYNVENDPNNEGLKYSSKDFEIMSTITSNYLIITIDQDKSPDSVYCNYLGKMMNRYDFLCIGLNNSSGYENLGIGIRYDYASENRTIGKSQQYDSKKKRWSKVDKKSFPYSEYY
ncbi:MAG: hypothetical protein J5625_04330 [Lachnospiraceae bacterium]|nr:hypothetical protein [Lachnospiraceae bacterium]